MLYGRLTGQRLRDSKQAWIAGHSESEFLWSEPLNFVHNYASEALLTQCIVTKRQ